VVRYVYFRNPRTRKLTPLPLDETSAEFATAYEPLLAQLKQSADPHAVRPPEQRGRWKNPRDYAIDPKVVFRPGSIGWFIDLYKKSNEYARLSKGTRYNYGFALDLMKKEIGAGMLHDLSQRHVDVYSGRIERQKAGSVADQQTNLITNLWDFAKDFSEFKPGDKLCPTIGAKRRYQHDGDGILAWPIEIIEEFQETAKPHLVSILNGLRYTGQRGSELVKMKWTDYDGAKINVVQQKTGTRIWLHCPAGFKKMLDAMPRHGDYIFNSCWKRPYEHAGTLGTAICIHVQKKLKHPDYSMHGLRKNAGMELALAGCTVPEIMAVLGHKSPKMAIFYVQQADKVRLGETATAKWESHITATNAERAAKRRAALKRINQGQAFSCEQHANIFTKMVAASCERRTKIGKNTLW
jgi:integrase